MLFNSIEFAIFLPIVFLLYWFVFNRNLKLQNIFIVVASYVFYGWWDWRFLVLLAFTSLFSYASGLAIEKYRDTPRKAKTANILNIVINLLILGVFKYYNFFVTSFADAFLGAKTDGLLLKVILPVGISFYTFKALSYSIDVYREKLKPTHDVIQYCAYVGFFPQLLAGPIERATNLLPQLEKPRTFDYETGVDGLRQILWGLFKKMVIADNCAVYVDRVFSTYQTQSGSTLLLAAIFFAFQIYGDFSGYSDMAIGTGKLFGFKTMKNFNFPYFSRDIAEFWRRWHISLTTWFRDYVYIPLGGSRCSKAKIVRNTFVIFLLSGLWHGANWTFIAWGAFHAFLFLPLILMGKNRKYRDTVAEGRLLPSLKEFSQMLLTFFLATVGWIIFKADSIGQAWNYLKGICSASLFSHPDASGVTGFAVAIVIMLLVEWFQRDKEHGFDLSGIKWGVVRYAAYLVVLFLTFAFGGHAVNFIYFQF
ncbi:MAG: MBOAT family protein [Bacteroidales bacterium]|nr:MBOAT family protein [Bacteroidales bacterium]